MQHTGSLKRLRALFRRDDPTVDFDTLSGPTLIDQEPDLKNESARYNLAAASWAAGHSSD